MEQSERPKCGTCRFFVVKNPDEAMLAQIARPESECAPGEHTFRGQRIQGCVGGGVRGSCLKWRERKAPNPMVDSTFMCKLYQSGGPTIKGMESQVMGSASRVSGDEDFGGAKADSPLVALGLGAAVVAGTIWLKKWMGR
jgi:hypothetical protein